MRGERKNHPIVNQQKTSSIRISKKKDGFLTTKDYTGRDRSGANELDELMDDIVVYWYVRAIDTNTEGTLSTQNPVDGTEISFAVYIPEPPEALTG